MAREVRADQAVPMAQEAQEGPNTPVGRADQADPVDRTVPAAQGAQMGTTGPAALVDPEVPVARAVQVGPDGRVTEAPVGPVGPTTMAGTGGRHLPTWRGAAWTRAGSTTSRSTTTAAG